MKASDDYPLPNSPEPNITFSSPPQFRLALERLPPSPLKLFSPHLKLLPRITSTSFMVIYASHFLVELISLDPLKLFDKLLKRMSKKDIEKKVRGIKRKTEVERESVWGRRGERETLYP